MEDFSVCSYSKECKHDYLLTLNDLSSLKPLEYTAKATFRWAGDPPLGGMSKFIYEGDRKVVSG